MRAVKSKNSKIEISLMQELRKRKIAYKKHVPNLPGTPDIVLKKEKVAIFVDSCFWHGCRWHGTMPASNRKFWTQKISANKARDKRVTVMCRNLGWKVLRFWEHQLEKDFDGIADRIQKQATLIR